MSDETASAAESQSAADTATGSSAESTHPAPDARPVVVCCDGPAAGTASQSAASRADTGESVDGNSAADIEGEEDDTTSTQMRHWLTNDILAGFLHLTLVAVVLAAGLGHLDLAAIPPRMRLVFLGTVLSATVWSFGEDVLQSIRGS